MINENYSNLFTAIFLNAIDDDVREVCLNIKKELTLTHGFEKEKAQECIDKYKDEIKHEVGHAVYKESLNYPNNSKKNSINAVNNITKRIINKILEA